MPINGPAIISRLLAPEMIGPVASAFHIDRNIAQSAVSTADATAAPAMSLSGPTTMPRMIGRSICQPNRR